MRRAATALLVALTALCAVLTVRLLPANRSQPTRRAVYAACMADAPNTFDALKTCVDRANEDH